MQYKGITERLMSFASNVQDSFKAEVSRSRYLVHALITFHVLLSRSMLYQFIKKSFFKYNINKRFKLKGEKFACEPSNHGTWRFRFSGVPST